MKKCAAVSLTSHLYYFSLALLCRCFISGWGAPEEGGDVEPALLNATVEIIDDFVCNGDEWLDGLVATDVMLCAGKESGEVDACQVRTTIQYIYLSRGT